MAYGADQSFAITADANHHIVDVLVDGVSVGAVRDYAFTDVTAPHSIAASFALTTAPISATTYTFAADDSSGWVNADQTVILTASGGSGGLRTIHYSADGGASWVMALATPEVAVTISDEGSHHFLYYASDVLATETECDAGYVNLDKSKPRTSAKRLSVLRGKWATFTFRITHSTIGCSQAVVKLQIKRGKRTIKTVTAGLRQANGVSTYRFRVGLKKGAYTWRALATDVAGNKASMTTSARLVVK